MKQSRQENTVYLVVWGLLFAAPLLSLYIRTVSDSNITFDWTEVFLVWRKFAVYLVLFLIHNFLLAPLLVHGRKRMAYFSIVMALLVAFTLYQCNNRHERDHGPRFENRGHQASRGFEGPGARGYENTHEGQKPYDISRSPVPPHPHTSDSPLPPAPSQPLAHNPHTPPPFVGEHDILAIIVLILMFAANLGVKNYFRTRDDRKRLEALERQNLEQQLEYLRYQISPHFFMNTLNNIHALVDIEPEKAKDTILELSKMMRFVLYEGNKNFVPLGREFDFIRHYVTLMQLRYTDKVRITVSLPDEVPDRLIPPLILITFIENAFKHGVSYQHETFIEIAACVDDDTLRFSCCNSKTDTPNHEKGGVGLANIRKRLSLIYEKRYTLRITNEPGSYAVMLTLPLDPVTPLNKT